MERNREETDKNLEENVGTRHVFWQKPFLSMQNYKEGSIRFKRSSSGNKARMKPGRKRWVSLMKCTWHWSKRLRETVFSIRRHKIGQGYSHFLLTWICAEFTVLHESIWNDLGAAWDDLKCSVLLIAALKRLSNDLEWLALTQVWYVWLNELWSGFDRMYLWLCSVKLCGAVRLNLRFTASFYFTVGWTQDVVLFSWEEEVTLVPDAPEYLTLSVISLRRAETMFLCISYVQRAASGSVAL